jgi:hypothetical protein
VCKRTANLLSACIILFKLGHLSPLTAQSVADGDDASAYISLHATLEGITIDINADSYSDLAAFPLIGSRAAQHIIDHRATHGSIPDMATLGQLLEWSEEEVERAIPYTRFGRKLLSTARQKHGPRLRARIQTRVTASSREWSDARTLTRSFVQTPNLEAAFVVERDQGETSMLDHTGGYLKYRATPDVTFYIGDVRPGIGVGTLYARQTRSALGSPVSRANGIGKLGTVSSDENGALRGVAARTTFRNLSILALYARSTWDATIQDSLATLRLSGQHATENGIAGKDALGEITKLLIARVGTKDTSIGVTLSRSAFTHLLDLNGIQGRAHTHAAVEVNLRLGSGHVFGEIVRSQSTASESQQRALSAVGAVRFGSRTQRLTILGRRLEPEYVGIRSAPPAAYGGNNEQGIGISTEMRRSGLRLSALIDRHATLERPDGWSRGRTGTRSRLSANLRMHTRLSLEARVATVQESAQKPEIPDRFSRNVRLRLKLSTGRNALTAWAEHARGRDGEKGRAIAGGGDLRLSNHLFKLGIWIAYGHRSGAGGRIYGFRPEVWGGRSVILLPSDGYAATGRLVITVGPLGLTLVYHHLPSRRLAAQLTLSH